MARFEESALMLPLLGRIRVAEWRLLFSAGFVVCRLFLLLCSLLLLMGFRLQFLTEELVVEIQRLSCS